MDDMENMTADDFDRLAATGQPVQLKVNLPRRHTGDLFTVEVKAVVGMSMMRGNEPTVRSNGARDESLATA